MKVHGKTLTTVKGCGVIWAAGGSFALTVRPANLRDRSVIIVQQSTEPLLALHWSDAFNRRGRRDDQPISKSLMVSLFPEQNKRRNHAWYLTRVGMHGGNFTKVLFRLALKPTKSPFFAAAWVEATPPLPL
jgi:hypothetical protein